MIWSKARKSSDGRFSWGQKGMSQEAVLEGAVSVCAALEAQNRAIEAVYVQRGKRSRSISRVERMARAAKVPVHTVERAFVDEHASGKTHGGVIALVGPRHFVALPDLLPVQAAPFVVMLDGIEDPFNFGAAVRAVYAAGAHGLVLRPRNWMSAAGVVARSSAGASEQILVAIAETVQEAAAFFRTKGLRIVCAAKNKSASLYEADLTVPLFLVVGGEKRGITRSFLDQADLYVEIPYGRSFGRSLGTASAVAVLAFEVMRQRIMSTG